MPRKARIDAPSALHHIICRGIEKTEIFYDDANRDSFVERLGRVISETQTPRYAWVLIPYHKKCIYSCPCFSALLFCSDPIRS